MSIQQFLVAWGSVSICSQVPQIKLMSTAVLGSSTNLMQCSCLNVWSQVPGLLSFVTISISPPCLTGSAKVSSACQWQGGRWPTWPLPGRLQRLLWTACCTTAASPLTLQRWQLLRPQLWPRTGLGPSACRQAMDTLPLKAWLPLLSAVPPRVDQVLTATACGGDYTQGICVIVYCTILLATR